MTGKMEKKTLLLIAIPLAVIFFGDIVFSYMIKPLFLK